MSTVLDAWLLYDELVLSTLTQKEQDTERGRWKKHIAPVFATIDLEAIKTLDVLRFKRHLEKKELSPQSVLHCLSLLRTVLRKAQFLELYEGKLPFFDMPKFDNRRQRFLSHDEAAALLHHMKLYSILWHDICLFALQTGLRASEIFNLKREQVSFNYKIITIFDSKNNLTRHVPMNNIAEKILLKHLPSAPRDLIFTNSGRPIQKVSKFFKAALKKTGINEGVSDRRSKVVFHTLRHTFASWLVQLPAGTPLHLVSELLGHKTLRMTQRYAHLDSSQRLRAVQALAKVFADGKRNTG